MTTPDSPDPSERTGRLRAQAAALSTARGAAAIMITLSLFGALLGVLINLAQTPKWTASTSVMVKVGEQDKFALNGEWSSPNFEDQIDLASVATNQDALITVARRLNLPDSLADLQENVTASPKGSSHVIVFSATQPDPELAQRVADAVATNFVEDSQRNMESLLQSLPPVPAPASAPDDDHPAGAEPAPAPPGPDPEIVARASLLSNTIKPLQVFHDDLPSRPSPARTPAALAVVGLAAGALVVLALTFLGQRVDRARDAQRLLSLPAVDYDRSGNCPDADRLVSAMLREQPSAELLVCPVDPDSELAAVRFAGWVRKQGEGEDDRVVRLVPDPTSAVVGGRPAEGSVAGLLLVVPRGTPRQSVSDSVELLRTWVPASGVVVAS